MSPVNKILFFDQLEEHKKISKSPKAFPTYSNRMSRLSKNTDIKEEFAILKNKNVKQMLETKQDPVTFKKEVLFG